MTSELTTAELDVVRARVAGLGRVPDATDVADALRWAGHVVSDETVLVTQEELRRDSVGAGLLDPLLHEAGVTDVLVNGPDRVFVDRGEGLVPAGVTFPSDEAVRRLATRLAALVGRRLDEGSPFVDARLPDGTRVHAVLSTLASPGTCLSLRVPARRRLSLDDWVRLGSVSTRAADLLRSMVERRVAFMVSGGTGTGKTTLLSSLLGLVPGSERILIVEDSRELHPDHPHVVRLEARPPNAERAGAITLTDLVRQALRMRPDRVVLGEVRGAEICDLLLALNTGHEGGCGTVHANSATDVPARLEALAALGGLPRDAAHAQLAAALEVVVHVARSASGQRRVAEIATLVRDLHGHVASVPGWTCDEAGTEARGESWPELARRLGATSW
ncbi:MAG TPA: TadA family conjugal transfer-associated ATPase [Propionibacteriaceae bacterium]|nr:TadA family conjugal transfer-associated ATPase [Propionibacteriaceae bacterium]HQE32363.1 TadA family conjugal transfer-associated ATPase [Propionibacteriaceae bacterium]